MTTSTRRFSFDTLESKCLLSADILPLVPLLITPPPSDAIDVQPLPNPTNVQVATSLLLTITAPLPNDPNATASAATDLITSLATPPDVNPPSLLTAPVTVVMPAPTAPTPVPMPISVLPGVPALLTTTPPLDEIDQAANTLIGSVLDAIAVDVANLITNNLYLPIGGNPNPITNPSP